MVFCNCVFVLGQCIATGSYRIRFVDFCEVDAEEVIAVFYLFFGVGGETGARGCRRIARCGDYDE